MSEAGTSLATALGFSGEAFAWQGATFFRWGCAPHPTRDRFAPHSAAAGRACARPGVTEKAIHLRHGFGETWP